MTGILINCGTCTISSIWNGTWRVPGSGLAEAGRRQCAAQGWGLSEDVIVQASGQWLVGPISDPNCTGHGDRLTVLSGVYPRLALQLPGV